MSFSVPSPAPGLSSWPFLPAYASSWFAPLDSPFASLLAALRRREVRDPRVWSEQTLSLLELSLAKGSPAELTTGILFRLIRRIGATLTAASPTEMSIGNTVRRVLALLRKEARAAAVTAWGEGCKWMEVPAEGVTALVATAVGEMRDEFGENVLVKDARKYVAARDVVLTYDYSPTVIRFLRKAAEDRTFEVFVAETAPSLSGHQTATALAQAGISATLVSDAAVLAIMPAVSKVIVDAHAVLADGAILAHAGAGNLCMAAHRASVPVVALAGAYKLSPLFAFDQGTFNEPQAPALTTPFPGACEGRVDVVSPALDLVPPQQVSLVVTSSEEGTAACQPSYAYRVVAQLYDTDDYDLDEVEGAETAPVSGRVAAVATCVA